MSFNKNKSTITEILQQIRDVIVDEENFEILELKNPIENKDEDSYSLKVGQDSDLQTFDTEQLNNNSNVKNNNLISEQNTEIADKAIKNLLNNIDIVKQKNQTSKSMTVEQLVTQSVSPLLAKWLNDNLASLVKKLVEKEIQKITINNL